MLTRSLKILEIDGDSRPASPAGPPGDSLALRALVTTKEAGVIIGKAGKNVADLRERTGVKAGVSKVVPGVHERVLSISGSVESIAKVRPISRVLRVSALLTVFVLHLHLFRWHIRPPQAYSLIISQLLEPEVSASSPTTPVVPPSHTSLRLLISHNLMGTIIGRQGMKIKAIQDASGTRMIASKDMLPQSTERVVEVQGTAEGIGRAVEEIGTCLLEDWERGLGTVLYHPGAEGSSARSAPETKRAAVAPSTAAITSKPKTNGAAGRTNGNGNSNAPAVSTSSPPSSPPNASNTAGAPSNSSRTTAVDIRTQNISIPSDMVGCIIGRAGTKITEIRRLSGSKISIAKTPHDETGERMFTIVGTAEANEKALFLLYAQLESEKERRVGKEIAE